ncbi:MAG: S49 family peptidase [Proteobacteria bacterium]|nr:S49 family peptidase [Pseudomonadota bacterium]
MNVQQLLSLVTFRPPRPRVAVLRLAGVIGPLAPIRGGINMANTADLIERAFRLSGLSAVALAINSPGGAAAQSALIAKHIRDLADEKGIPVFAFVEDVAASGGYWLACAADEIHVDENSIVGSIGVISSGFGFAEAIGRLGIERRIHTQGAKKSLLDPFRPESAEDLERLTGLQTEIHANFKEAVRRRRGERLKLAEKELFSGEVWTGRRAVELGLADGVGDMRAVMRARFGDKVQFRRIAPARGWLRRRAGLEAPAPAEWADALVGGLVARALWNRYGL